MLESRYVKNPATGSDNIRKLAQSLAIPTRRRTNHQLRASASTAEYRKLQIYPRRRRSPKRPPSLLVFDRLRPDVAPMTIACRAAPFTMIFILLTGQRTGRRLPTLVDLRSPGDGVIRELSSSCLGILRM